MKQQAAKGHSSKHAGSHKHARAHAKHHPAKQHAQHQAKGGHGGKQHTVAKHPGHAKARGAQRGTLEVLPPRTGTGAGPRQVPGASLHDWHACAAVALGASLSLAGGTVRDSDVAGLHMAAGGSEDRGVSIPAVLLIASAWGLAGRVPVTAPAFLAGPWPAGTILGVELPGSHAVCVAPDGCWLSWGEHYCPDDFPDAVVEEAWAVSWP